MVKFIKRRIYYQYFQKVNFRLSITEVKLSIDYLAPDYVLLRLLDHIQFLANIANQYHEEYFCDLIHNNYTIKKDCLNKITRLSLYEFALYTSRPLDENHFPLLIN